MANARRPARWGTTFGRWVDAVGVQEIVKALDPHPHLRVTQMTVYDWLSGRVQPTPARARALEILSGGQISLDAIYRHVDELGQEATCKSTSRSTTPSSC